MRGFALAGLLMPAGLLAASSAAPPASTVDWPAFLARQDLVWTHPPEAMDEAPFIGNGTIGAFVHLSGDALAWDVNRADVTYLGRRTHMGRLVLQPPNRGFDGGSARLDLWNGEVSGTLDTDPGEIHWRTFASGNPSAIVIELWGLRAQPGAGLVWLADLARPAEAGKRPEAYSADELNPPPEVVTDPEGRFGVVTSVQTFVKGGAFAVVLKRIASEPDHKIYVLSIGKGEHGGEALAEAMSEAEQATAQGLGRLVAANRAWWHAYYPESFVSLPDARLEAFYWIQMYKLGSIARANGPIADDLGPWYRPGATGRIDWDGGVQLTYAPLIESNRLDSASSLFGALDRRQAQLIANVPPGLRGTAAGIGHSSDQSLASPVDLAQGRTDFQRELGNLPWAVYVYWQYERARGDDAALRSRVLPLLARAVGLYVGTLRKGPDGRYHLPPTYSPGSQLSPDSAFDVALLRWGLATVVRATSRIAPNDPRLPHWREVLGALPNLSLGRAGFMQREFGAVQSEPFYPGLFAIDPLHLVNVDRPEPRRLLERALGALEGRPARMRGYAYAAAASMHAVLGDGDAAIKDLHLILDRFVSQDTFATGEGDGLSPLDGPLATAGAVDELLLQDWGGRVRVFPAVPAAWREADFQGLRVDGGFLISGVRHAGGTVWVKVQNPVGGKCRLAVAGWARAVVRASDDPLAAVTTNQPGDFTLAIARGRWAVLAASADGALPALAVVPHDPAQNNPYPGRYRAGVASRRTGGNAG